MDDPASEELFATQVDRLVDTVGPIEVVSVGLNPSSGLEPLGDGEHTRAVRVELAGREQAGSEPLEMVVLEQDDELRLCGVATASAVTFTATSQPFRTLDRPGGRPSS